MAHPLAENNASFHLKWKYEFINRISREILVFYDLSDNVKGSIVLDTPQEKEEWMEFLRKLGFSMRSS